MATSGLASSPSYDVKQGVDFQRIFLLLLKWPIYAFKLLRRGRFATIAELRRDAYMLSKSAAVASQARRFTRSDSEDLTKGLRSTLGSAKIAIAWAAVLVLLMTAESVLPQLQGVLASLMFAASSISILIGLSSIARDSSSISTGSPPTLFSSLLAGGFFVVSTLPFSLPWVLAFFFPKQCLLFFTTWAVFGAIINEVSVLVAHARMMRGGPLSSESKKTDEVTPDISASDQSESKGDSPTRVRPHVVRRRSRKTTEQRIATVSNFTLDDRKDLEDYISSDEGLKWWAAFLGMQATVSGMAVFLRLFVDTVLVDPALITFALLMSMCMLCESFWMTYAVGGRWLHFRQKWRFFQPFAGGDTFFSMQIVAWVLFFVFLVVSLADLRKPSQEAFEIYHEQIPEWARRMLSETFLATFQSITTFLKLDKLPTGSVALCGVFAELIMLVSLPLFRGAEDRTYMHEGVPNKDGLLDEILVDVVKDDKPQPARPRQEPSRSLAENFSEDVQQEEDIDPYIKQAMAKLQQKRGWKANKSQFSVPFWELCADAVRTAWLSPIVLTLVKPEVTLFLTGFLLTKFVHGASFFGLFNIHLPYLFIFMELAYLPTYIGNPRRSGHRRWWNIRGTWIYDELSAYWFMNIIREKELIGSERHIFGYHPHGMFPMGASYIHNTSMWMELFPTVTPFSLTATITHIVPLLRDVTQFNGGLEVTQESFSRALMKFKNVMIVPGGQHEMLLFSEDPNETVLSSKHKGFIRLALLSAANNPNEIINLVPIYAFREADMLYNAFPASRSLQRWLVAKIRLNPAFLPVGRFHLAGVPKRVPITFVVGAPIRVPVPKGIPTEQQIDLLAARYYTAVEETFEKHKGLCDGFAKAKVSFVPELDRVSKQEFDNKWAALANHKAGELSDIKHKKESIPIPEYCIAIFLTNVCLWTPYWFFG